MNESRKTSPTSGPLTVALGRGLVLKNPVMTASGTFGYGAEHAPYLDLNRLGAVVVKGLSREARPGNPPPRIFETPAGMLNAVGLQNVGVKAFIKEKLPFLRDYDTKVIANIFGESLEDYCHVAEALSTAKGVHGIELNISCPNVKKGGVAFGALPEAAAEITARVRQSTDLPLIVKLTPNVTDITVIARAVAAAGADALSLINTLTGMAVDIESRRPRLANVTGGLSGPAIRPVALRMVWQTVQAVAIPVIGIGGIASASDALEFLICGARAVQVGTAGLAYPPAAGEVVLGIEAYLQRHGLERIDALIGSLDTTPARGAADGG